MVFGCWDGPIYAEDSGQKRRSGRSGPHASGWPPNCLHAKGLYASRPAAHGRHVAACGEYASTMSDRDPAQDWKARHQCTTIGVLPWLLRHLTTHRHVICIPTPHLPHPQSPASCCSFLSHIDHTPQPPIHMLSTRPNASLITHQLVPPHTTTHPTLSIRPGIVCMLLACCSSLPLPTSSTSLHAAIRMPFVTNFVFVRNYALVLETLV